MAEQHEFVVRPIEKKFDSQVEFRVSRFFLPSP
jgi:hypothetical protein